MTSTPSIGTAGWNIPKCHVGQFPGDGSHLARYAGRFTAVEINSSFYRPHRPATYARWAASVPPEFRFAVKLPREISHGRKLVGSEECLERFLGEVETLGDRLGPILVQLPPSFRYGEAIVAGFLEALRARYHGNVVCEPRHPSWFADDVDALLSRFQVARVAADPAVIPRAARPGGWPGLVYRRLHGSPRVYYSAYAPEYIEATARAMREESAKQGWCIFDNTADGAAAKDALGLLKRLEVSSEFGHG